MADAIGLSSTSSVAHHLGNLETQRGALVRDGPRLAHLSPGAVTPGVPLRGHAPLQASRPTYEAQNTHRQRELQHTQGVKEARPNARNAPASASAARRASAGADGPQPRPHEDLVAAAQPWLQWAMSCAPSAVSNCGMSRRSAAAC
ncbi:hypothetical protein [Streptomyces sp. NBC_00988]|uniref:hypothetical protein n=1 Tax=Streptomyces sp. NBC_00988 TaxID=2903704 RepID=UPI00386EB54C